MSYPGDPKTLQVLNRILTVLAEISPADGYFYPVGKDNVLRGVKGWDEITSFPFDMAYLGDEHQEPEHEMDGIVKKFPTIYVEGYADAQGEDDTITRIAKHLADVQRAINEDTKPGGGPGSLGVIAHYCRVGRAEMDNGILAGTGKAGFRLTVQACVSGEWGEV